VAIVHISAASRQYRTRNKLLFLKSGSCLAFIPDLIDNGIHNIQGEVSPENVIALFDTAYESGFYD
jgi:hypothetical protein